MKVLNTQEFKELIQSNPSKRHAFFEYKSDMFLDNIHVTDGNAELPFFGATSIIPDDMNYRYDWNLNEYNTNDKFAILEDEDVKSLIKLLSSTLDGRDKQ